jgi:hypothetical protein
MVDGQGSEVSHEKLVSKEIKKKESSPAAFPFKNLVDYYTIVSFSLIQL